ncbi:J domain-containing protein [Haloarchaeobius amylolyticus]|uniref:J domain-containing protein n=1 Tax=Haloarchaeobius amylolyticus TaxID=1198296 RepID=UPI002270DDA1|nr:J domain-containing protein [Haloarchaeobius amylolyticus]
MAVADRQSCDGCDRQFAVERLSTVTMPGGSQSVCCPDCRRFAESARSKAELDRDEHECDGCSRTYPLSELSVVDMPGGSQSVCCPECRTYAESVGTTAELGQRRRECDGCSREFALDNLAVVDMPGGTQSICCPECKWYAESVSTTAELGDRQRECDGCTTTFPVSELEEIVLSDGTSVLCCPTCREHAPEPTATDEVDDEQRKDAERETASELAEKDPSKAIQTRNLCTQCKEWCSVELYPAEINDSRTENLCPDCLEIARSRGIVTEVGMRRADAYDALGIEPVDDAGELRDAYIDRVKDVHPDRAGGSREAFKRVQRAYERLESEF